MGTNNKTIHILPCIPEYYDRIEKTNKEEQDNAGFWYFHGELEKQFRFDKGTMTNCNTLGISKPFVYDDNEQPVNKLYYNGEIDCEVEGCDKPCVAFLYTTNETSDTKWIQRGLVCIKEDTEACNHARKKMKEKSIIL